jgi:hypothetical protein
MFTEWTTGLEITTLTNITTSWYIPVQDPNFTPTPTTAVLNSTLSSLLPGRTVYCWIDQTDHDNALTRTAILPQMHRSRRLQQGFPLYVHLIDQNVPTTTSTPAATPTPTQPGIVSGCTKFHRLWMGIIARRWRVSLVLALIRYVPLSTVFKRNDFCCVVLIADQCMHSLWCGIRMLGKTAKVSSSTIMFVWELPVKGVERL